MYDLACAWRSLAVDNELRAVPEDWAWFREGYEALGKLPPAAWQQVNALACLRAFWTMALPVEASQEWGKAWRADPSYWNAHLEQIKWFAQHDP